MSCLNYAQKLNKFLLSIIWISYYHTVYLLSHKSIWKLQIFHSDRRRSLCRRSPAVENRQFFFGLHSICSSAVCWTHNQLSKTLNFIARLRSANSVHRTRSLFLHFSQSFNISSVITNFLTFRNIPKRAVSP
jgi:hypothetical protein